METTYRDSYNLQQSICASDYEASQAKSLQEHEKISKSARDFKIIYAQDI